MFHADMHYQRFSQRRHLGPPRIGAAESCYMLPCSCTPSNRREGRRSHEREQQQRGRYGAEAPPILEEASEKVLVGGRGVAWGRRCRGETEGLDSEGVDFGDG